MKKMRRHALLVTLCAWVFYAQAQQAQLISALIDGCASGNDGADEWVMIYSGGSAFTASTSNLQVLYGTADPATTNFTQSFRAIDATTNSFVSGLNTRITDQGSCNFSFVNADPGTTNIAAESHVLIFNDDVLTSGTTIDYDAWCATLGMGSTIYVLFSTDSSWPTSGLFANAPTGNRYFRSTINSNTVDFNYSDNWVTTAGNYVTWNDGGGAGATYSNYTGCQPNDSNALPIVLLDFSAMAGKNHVSLHWSTAEEMNNSHFTIERSKNAMQWETLALIGGAGSSQEVQTYQYQDYSPYPGRSYYRLSQTDFNGTSETFETLSVIFDPMGIDLKIYPNPSSNFIEVNCSEVIDCLTLIDSQGRQYRVDKAYSGTMNGRFDIRHLPKGVYRVLIHGSRTVFREKLIKVD